MLSGCAKPKASACFLSLNICFALQAGHHNFVTVGCNWQISQRAAIFSSVIADLFSVLIYSWLKKIPGILPEGLKSEQLAINGLLYLINKGDKNVISPNTLSTS